MLVQTQKQIIIKSIQSLLFTEYKKINYIDDDNIYYVVYNISQLFQLKPVHVYYII